ncbi:uncharacterized protein V1518DRAFT_409634 [Limtongia smithiae]|uniref:uncharacterized protein n=1 Tax=Limtongia smithiae TaxID=1125753 RepID=UPI0034CD6EB5
MSRSGYYAIQLREFIGNSSHENLRIVHCVSPNFLKPKESGKKLIVLDSSFNPPTLAHLELVNRTIAMRECVTKSNQLLSAEVLLLLAVKNADKKAAPAAFEDRLAMIELFSRDVGSGMADITVEVAMGITTRPIFVDKAAAIQQMFPGIDEQIYIIGYDTLIRLLNPKYYKDQDLVAALSSFMDTCKIVCFIRDSEEWGTADEQKQFVLDIRGGKAKDGIPMKWGGRIIIASYDEDSKRHDAGLPSISLISSTAARAAAKSGLVSSQ